MQKDFVGMLKKEGFSKSHAKYGMSLYRKRFSKKDFFEVGVILTNHYPKSHLVEVEVGLYCASIEELFAKMSGVYEKLGAMWLTFSWKSVPNVQWDRVNDESYYEAIKENQIKFMVENIKRLSDHVDQVNLESISCLENLVCNTVFMSENEFKDNISRYATYYIILNYSNGKNLEDLFNIASEFIVKNCSALQYESFIMNYSLFSKYVDSNSLKSNFLNR